MQNKIEFETTNRSVSSVKKLSSPISKFYAEDKIKEEMMISAAKEHVYMCQGGWCVYKGDVTMLPSLLSHTQCLISVVRNYPGKALTLPRDTKPNRKAEHSELHRLAERHCLQCSEEF